MSEEKTESGEALAETKREVVVTPEDCAAAFDFWKHFNVPVMPGLGEAFKTFMDDPTVENQDRLKHMVTKAIAETKHEAFEDPLFTRIREECADVSYAMEFDRQLEEALTKNEE